MSDGRVDPMWTVKDVMRVLCVKKSWVYAHADAGDLPHFRIGGHIRFEPKDVLAYIERCKSRPAKLISLKLKPEAEE